MSEWNCDKLVNQFQLCLEFNAARIVIYFIDVARAIRPECWNNFRRESLLVTTDILFDLYSTELRPGGGIFKMYKYNMESVWKYRVRKRVNFLRMFMTRFSYLENIFTI